MLSTSDFCKREYGTKLYKISFDAGFTCPNRDGSKGDRGCIFCSAGGSGDFAVRLPLTVSENDGSIDEAVYNKQIDETIYNKQIDEQLDKQIDEQIELAKKKVASKYKGDKYIAYFQAFTNTYAVPDTLRKIYFPIAKREDIAVISIATRPDCLSEDTYAFLKELMKIKPVWVELGLQTTKQSSIKYIRRGYENETYDHAVKRLNELGIHTITHVILFLPGESLEDMKNTVRHAIAAGTQGIKLQLLHVLKGTDLAAEYLAKNFYIPTLNEYCDVVTQCIKLCPDNIVIHRFTGDAPKNLLIEPKWSADKKTVMNTVRAAITKITVSDR